MARESGIAFGPVYRYAASLSWREASKIMITTADVSRMKPEARIEVLKNAPANGWVAFSENEEELVAYGTTYDEVVRKAEESGVSEPVVVKVPPAWNDLVL
jgi:uncharacterized protein DUF5678